MNQKSLRDHFLRLTQAAPLKNGVYAYIWGGTESKAARLAETVVLLKRKIPLEYADSS